MTFRLQVLHASDLEGGPEAIDKAPNFAAIIDKLEDDTGVDGSVTLSAGDNYISGPFFAAASDASLRTVFNEVFNQFYGLPTATGYNDLREGSGRVDIAIMNVVGFDASALGNHEFDLGTAQIASIIGADLRSPAGPGGDRWVGAQFPYLSANLDFAADPNLSTLFTPDTLPTSAFQNAPGGAVGGPKIAPATVIEVGGEEIVVIGATTPLLETISSPGATQVRDPGAGTNDMAALAQILQPVIDAQIALGRDKIVLVTHLQQITLEQQLVPLLEGVDIVIAGGSDSILANPDDPLNPGDVAVAPYPIVTANADGDPTVIVNTAGEYSYVGRLVVEFDDNGILVDAAGNPIDDLADLDLGVNGPIATTDDAVAALWGTDDAFADGTKGDLVEKLVDAVSAVVTAQDGNVFGETTVFLEGRREKVRTEETNFGNLSADANLWVAQQTDPEVIVSIKNGGGIRNAIGLIENEVGGTQFLPPEDGDISQLDIADSLRFNNGLTLLTVTAAQLLQVVEHAVAASGPGLTPGQFGQFGGLKFSFDVTRPANDRVQSLVIVDDAGTVVDVIAEGGELVGEAGRAIRIVTLNFLAGGGDSYPFSTFIAADPAFADRVDLVDPAAPNTGIATFAPDGSEQDALAEYLATFFPADDDPATPSFDAPETSASQDERIQQIGLRNDGILVSFVRREGSDTDADSIVGGGARDLIQGLGLDDTLLGDAGEDIIDGGSGNDSINAGTQNDIVFGGDGDDTVAAGRGDDTVYGGDGADSLRGFAGADSIDGGLGDDQLTGDIAGDTMLGGGGADTARGGDGEDSLAGGADGDSLVGDAGRDTVVGDGGDDFLVGGVSNDSLSGGEGADTLFGGADRDTLDGGDGADSLVGGDQADRLFGGAGSDRLDGGLRDDTLTGGADADVFVIRPGNGRDIVTDFVDGEDVVCLGGGLDFADIAIVAGTAGVVGALITVAATGERLAFLEGVSAGDLGSTDFLVC